MISDFAGLVTMTITLAMWLGIRPVRPVLRMRKLRRGKRL